MDMRTSPAQFIFVVWEDFDDESREKEYRGTVPAYTSEEAIGKGSKLYNITRYHTVVTKREEQRAEYSDALRQLKWD